MTVDCNSLGTGGFPKIRICLIDKHEFQIEWARKRVLLFGANELADVKQEIKEEIEEREHQHEDSEEEGREEEGGVEQGEVEGDDEDNFEPVEEDDA